MEQKRSVVAALLVEMHFNPASKYLNHIDKPSNFEEIVDFCVNDINENADAVNWTSKDVNTAFRRWMESKSIANVQPEQESIAVKLQKHIDIIGEEAFQKEWEEFNKEWTAEHGEQIVHEPYFDIVSFGYNEELQREEIQIHAGENGNVFLIKNDDGFIVDVYSQNDCIDTMTIWEDDLTPEEEDDADVVFDFSYPKVMAFIKKWGKNEENVYFELGTNTDLDAQEQFTLTHFFEETNKLWILKTSPEYTEEEQAIADYLQQPVT